MQFGGIGELLIVFKMHVPIVHLVDILVLFIVIAIAI